MIFSDLTLNIGKNNVVTIEKEFEKTRSNYLRDLSKLHKRYARQFLKLTQSYSAATATAQQ